jgi:vacuolar-type H+-ATPase subunit H
MQKVVGSNPISRSRDRKMATGNRKQRNRKQTRTSRRGAEGNPTSSKPEVSQSDADQADGQEVSSLLETTGQEVKQLLEAADDAAKKIREAAQTEVDTDSGAGSGGGEVSTLINRTNKEVRQVLESADEAADKIRAEARAEARQFVDDARRRAEGVTSEHLDRVSKLTEQVLGELTGVQQQLESLRGAFDHAITTMAAEIDGEAGQVWDTQQNGAPEVEEDSELRTRLGRRRQRKAAHQEPEGISEGARLLALQQLMAGVDADVIEQRLKSEFGIEDPRPILQWMGLQAEKG